MAGIFGATSTTRRFRIMITDLASSAPTLAAGWAFLYLLLGGGLGGAFLIFFGLKLAGR